MVSAFDRGSNVPVFLVQALRQFANTANGNVRAGDRFYTSLDRAFQMQEAGLVKIIEGGSPQLETKRMDRPEAVGGSDGGHTGDRPILTVKRRPGRPRKNPDSSS